MIIHIIRCFPVFLRISQGSPDRVLRERTNSFSFIRAPPRELWREWRGLSEGDVDSRCLVFRIDVLASAVFIGAEENIGAVQDGVYDRHERMNMACAR